MCSITTSYRSLLSDIIDFFGGFTGSSRLRIHVAHCSFMPSMIDEKESDGFTGRGESDERRKGMRVARAIDLVSYSLMRHG